MKKVDFRKIGYQIWEKRLQILVTVFLFFLLSVAYTLNCTIPFYQSTIMLEAANEGSSTVDEKRMATYSSMLQSETMLEKTIQNLELNMVAKDLQKNISVKPIPETAFLQIMVKQENPQDATRIANDLAESFVQIAKETYHINHITLPDEASVPDRAYYMLPVHEILIFCLVGIILSVGYVGISSIVEQTKEANQIQKRKEKKEETNQQKKESKEEKEKISSNKEKGEKNETKPKRGRKKNS